MVTIESYEGLLHIWESLLADMQKANTELQICIVAELLCLVVVRDLTDNGVNPISDRIIRKTAHSKVLRYLIHKYAVNDYLRFIFEFRDRYIHQGSSRAQEVFSDIIQYLSVINHDLNIILNLQIDLNKTIFY